MLIPFDLNPKLWKVKENIIFLGGSEKKDFCIWSEVSNKLLTKVRSRGLTKVANIALTKVANRELTKGCKQCFLDH